jgi:hypothetical protein
MEYKKKTFAAFDSVRNTYTQQDIIRLMRHLPLLRGRNDSGSSVIMSVVAEHWADSSFVRGNSLANHIILQKLQNDLKLSGQTVPGRLFSSVWNTTSTHESPRTGSTN